MPYPSQPWRSALQPASFGGAGFKVEVDSQTGGRRNAFHEFPHRDTPWAEDMGRKGRRWNVVAYLIGPTYTQARDALIAACEQEGPRTLVHPLLGSVQACCDEYTAVERREQGGYVVVEMRFCEAGSNPGTVATADTQGQATTAAEKSDAAASQSFSSSTDAAQAANLQDPPQVNNTGFGTIPSNGFAGVPLT